MEKKEFSTAALASVTSGRLLCPFSDMHEAVEFALGHPVFTHQFPMLRDDMKRAILSQHPMLPLSLDDCTQDNWREKLAEIEAAFGKTLSITKGSGLTNLLPTDGIPDHVEVITVNLSE